MQPARQLLRKGTSNQETSDNLRVRADFLEGVDCAHIDVRVLGESDSIRIAHQRWAGAALKQNCRVQRNRTNAWELTTSTSYILLVLVQKGDHQPVGYTLSNKFQVRLGGVSIWSGHKRAKQHACSIIVVA